MVKPLRDRVFGGFFFFYKSSDEDKQIPAKHTAVDAMSSKLSNISLGTFHTFNQGLLEELFVPAKVFDKPFVPVVPGLGHRIPNGGIICALTADSPRLLTLTLSVN